MKIIAYHFIRNTDLGIHPISLERFESQCKYFKNKDYILTFDDGYKDHLNILPLLQKYNLKGIFFPCIMPLVEHKVFDFNKSQFLMAKLGDNMARLFENRFEIKLDRKTNHYNRFDTPFIGNYKLALHELSPEKRNEFLNDLFSMHFGDEEKFSKELYMDWNDLKKLINAGMEIGSHGYYHKLLNHNGQVQEIVESKLVLNTKLGIDVKWFCYPYGRYNSHSIELLRKSGYNHAITTHNGENTPFTNPYLLNRMDATEL